MCTGYKIVDSDDVANRFVLNTAQMIAADDNGVEHKAVKTVLASLSRKVKVYYYYELLKRKFFSFLLAADLTVTIKDSVDPVNNGDIFNFNLSLIHI